MPQVEYEDIIPGEGTLNKDLRDKKGGKTGIKFYAGDVLYGKLRPYLMNWLYPQFNGVAVGDFWVLRATECDSSFLYRLVQTGSFQRLANVSSGSKMPRADWNLISQSFFAVPADHAEQKAIAKGLAELDTLITLHQRKYDKLCVLKKSMLDKMFPKGGSLYPEIRFAGFTDPWEQRKLGDILQERNVRTSDFESNPIFSLTIEDGITPKTDRYERTSLITKTEDLFKIVNPNEFVTNPMNLRFGAFGYNKNSLSVCVSGYYDVFSIDNDKCSGFWNSYFKTPVALKRFDDAATGSLIEKRRVKYSTLCQLIFLMPKGMGEKKQIGAFFDRLDSLITLHQRKYCGVVSWMLGVALVRLGSESDGAFGEMKHVLR